MSKFAVIIPLYNHQRYIEETLEFVLTQTELPARVLVLDDGSPDASLERARAVAARNPVVEVHEQANQGAHNTLNRLAELADGCEYVAILNSDDRFHPERLERGGAFLDEHPETALLCTGLRIIGTEGAPLAADHPRAKWFRAAWSCQPAWQQGGLSLSAWLGRANFPATTSNFMARRDFLLAHPFRDYRFAHDYYCLLQAALSGGLALLPEPLLDYRVHENNTITTTPIRLTTELLKLILDLAEEVGPRLAGDATLRREWAAFLGALPRNISGVRWDCVAAAAGSGALDFPELAEFPNKELVNRWDETGDLWAGGDSAAGLARALGEARAQSADLKARVKAAKDLAKLRSALGQSRWVALGLALGFSKDLARDEGADPAEKLAKLRERLTCSAWLKAGRGFKGVKKVFGEPY